MSRGKSGIYTVVFFEYPRKKDPRQVEIGERYGNVVIEAYLGMNARRTCVYRCRCDCGRTFEALGTNIRLGRKKSCGYCDYGTPKKKKKEVPKREEPTDEIRPDDTLCWSCKHSHGNPCGQCKWAWSLKPIEGWDAEEILMKGHGIEGDFTSYKVKGCPEYERQRKGEHSVPAKELSDKGVERLITAMIKSAVEDYGSALKKLKRAFKRHSMLSKSESDEIWELYDFFYFKSPTLNNIHLPKVAHIVETREQMPKWLKENGLESVMDLIFEVDYKGEKNNETD